MKYIFLLIFGTILTTITMEQDDDSINKYDYILPFVHDNSLSINAIDEVNALANEVAPASLYREKTFNFLTHNNIGKGKNDHDAMQKLSSIPFGTIPFKSLIHCGVGYTALLTISLDRYFFYRNSYCQIKKKFKKIYQANNLVNIYYVIDMLNQISTTCITKMVHKLHTHYINNILLPKSVTTDTYKDKAQAFIKPKDTNILISCSENIDQFITYQNSDLLYVHLPLKDDVIEPLLQLLLQLYVFWKYSDVMNVMKVLPEHMSLFLEVSAVKHMAENHENIQNAFNTLIEQMKLIAKEYECSSDKEHSKAIEEKEDKRCSLVHNFLYVLNQYVYNLIAVPISIEKNNRAVNGLLVNKKIKKIANPNSFFEKNKQSIRVTKYVGLTILIVGLLYRLVKNNKNHIF